jgi:2EXR family
MLSFYNFISNRLGKGNPSQRDLGPNGSERASFQLFSSLPPELRRKIWHFALPTRLIEASLDFQSMHCFPLPVFTTDMAQMNSGVVV